ncbi:hypothetical protein I0D68_00760 [Pseudomonas lalucatii]|nr:hypothetical protein I0D68_00760 [Pseudomonas lalucatii]
MAFSPLGLLALSQSPQLGGAVLFACVSLCWLLLSLHAKPFAVLVAHSRHIVEHPIKQLIYTGRIDEIGQLQLSNRLQEARLASMVARIGDSSRRVSAHSDHTRQLLSTSNQAAEQQQQALDGISAAVEQLSATIQEVAGNTRNAAEQTHQAQALSNDGQRQVGNAHQSMAALAATLEQSAAAVTALSRHSQTIGGILEVIRSIAEQTNLLALNAAIEAARAGENGRGFAVVADEVRSLAQRTQASTDEIQGMIAALRQGTAQVVGPCSRACNNRGPASNRSTPPPRPWRTSPCASVRSPTAAARSPPPATSRAKPPRRSTRRSTPCKDWPATACNCSATPSRSPTRSAAKPADSVH